MYLLCSNGQIVLFILDKLRMTRKVTCMLYRKNEWETTTRQMLHPSCPLCGVDTKLRADKPLEAPPWEEDTVKME